VARNAGAPAGRGDYRLCTATSFVQRATGRAVSRRSASLRKVAKAMQEEVGPGAHPAPAKQYGRRSFGFSPPPLQGRRRKRAQHHRFPPLSHAQPRM